MSQPDAFDRPVAIVTGAANGIGHAIARRFLNDGFRIVAFDRSHSLPVVFAEALASQQSVTIVGDVTDETARTNLVTSTIETYGRLDVLVNNAGIGGFGEPVDELDLGHLRHTLEINTVAVAHLTRLAIPHLKESDRGRIINLGSLFADHPAARGADYTMSKGAIHAFTRLLAVELQAQSLGVTVEERLAQLRESVPLGRHGTSEDIAGAASWLASLDSAYVTGLKVNVNGGLAF